MEAEVEAVVEAEVEAVEEVAAEQQPVLRPQEEEGTPNSSAQNRLPSTGIGRMLTDSCRIFKDTCR